MQVRLCEQLDVPLELRMAAVHTIGQLGRVPRLSLKDYATRIIHPLARILEADRFHPHPLTLCGIAPVSFSLTSLCCAV